MDPGPASRKLFSTSVVAESQVVGLGILHFGIFDRNSKAMGFGLGILFPGIGLPRAIGIIGPGRIVNRKAHFRKISGPFGAGRNGKSRLCLRTALLRILVIREKEELVFLDRAADCSALLVTVKVGRSVALRRPTTESCLLKYSFADKAFGPEYPEHVAMKLIGAGLAHQADHSRAPALIRRRRILGFDANFLNTILGNIHRRNDGSGIVLRNSDRAAIEHVVNRSTMAPLIVSAETSTPGRPLEMF